MTHAARGRHAMLVSQVLRSKADDGVLTIRPGASVAEAARVMSERRVGSLVVSLDGRHAVGIMSERDVVRHCMLAPDDLAALAITQACGANVFSLQDPPTGSKRRPSCRLRPFPVRATQLANMRRDHVQDGGELGGGVAQLSPART